MIICSSREQYRPQPRWRVAALSAVSFRAAFSNLHRHLLSRDISTMNNPKKGVVLYSVAIMESPQRAPSDVYKAPHSSVEYGGFGLYADGERPVMEDMHHAQLESPPQSLAQTTTTSNSHKYRVLGTLGLFAIFYFSTCGGPVGSEPIISAGGPLVGLLGVLAYALLCQVPLSMMLTELCCAFPENGGYAVWALTAFGPFWGFQVGYLSWAASVLHNAIYPGLIYTMAAQAFNVEATSGAVAFVIKAAIAIVLAIPSWIGVRFIGLGAIVLLVVVGLSTLLFTVWGLADGENAWFRLAEVRAKDQATSEGTDGGIDWELLIHSLFWCFDSLYDISVIGGTVMNPVRTYPRVIVAVVVATVLTYTVPWISAVASDKYAWTTFTEDSFPDIADAVGGASLHSIILIGSILSMVAVYSCTLFFQAFLVQGMAKSQLLPAALRKRNARFNTPQYALLASLLATIVLLDFDHHSIMSMTNLFSAAGQIIMVATMLELRRSFPLLARPVKMAGGTVLIGVLLLPSVAVFIFTIGTALSEWDHAVVAAAFVVVGLIFPIVRQYLAGRITCC